MQFGYHAPQKQLAKNLLINPRGKINQANEADGVIAAGQYFCDGWKAGAAGAEVYVETDGFRLVSGSILQCVPNTLESDRLVRTNLDVISGNPLVKVNDVPDKSPAGENEFIYIEVSGNNSKFTRLVAADSIQKPSYSQSANELTPCLRFLYKSEAIHSDYSALSPTYSFLSYFFPVIMYGVPSVAVGGFYDGSLVTQITKSKVLFVNEKDNSHAGFIGGITLDARP